MRKIRKWRSRSRLRGGLLVRPHRNRTKSPRHRRERLCYYLFVALLIPSITTAQHLRIFACAIANDSAGAFMGGSSNGSGLYQSDDTGKTWRHLGWDNIKCYSMDEVQSSNGRILYEATGLGVLRSTDYGAHWKQLTDWRISEAMDVAVNQKNPSEIYIATAHGPWRSEDGGKMWTPLFSGLPIRYCSRIVIDSVIPNHVLLASEAGLFVLRHSKWYEIPCYEEEDSDMKRPIHIEAVRSLKQDYAEYWNAVSEKSGALLCRDDSGKTFRVIDTLPPYRLSGLWCWSSGPDVSTDILAGANGVVMNSLIDIESGYRVETVRIDSIRNVSDCLIVKVSNVPADQPPPYNGYRYHPIALLGTLGNGIFVKEAGEETWHKFLPHRQIWTLKSFLVTP